MSILVPLGAVRALPRNAAVSAILTLILLILLILLIPLTMLAGTAGAFGALLQPWRRPPLSRAATPR